MNETRQILEDLINNFSVEKFTKFFREKNLQFVASSKNRPEYDDDSFMKALQLGEIRFSEIEQVVIYAFQASGDLSEKLGKKAQYEKAKLVLKSVDNQRFTAGIFIFYDEQGSFRFSLVYPEFMGKRKLWNSFKRFTYFVSRDLTNKTFHKQIGEKRFSNLVDIKEAFSTTAVTDIFYDEFIGIYNKIVESVKISNQNIDDNKTKDFVLLFSIRTIFIGFISKKKWIGGKEKFVVDLFKEYYKKYSGKDEFYLRWLAPFFFEALNSPIGRKVAYGENDFSEETDKALQMAPYLNGGLFRKKSGYDDQGWFIPDQAVKDFFDFLFSHSFTIEENSLLDEDLQLNPEFLGIIFERLVNKDGGSVYTPRPEVDLMCRLSLVKWLQKNLESNVKPDNIYELFFKESEKEEDQKGGSFSPKEAQEILDRLENLAICDPAVGSGAFLVGMIHVLDEVEQDLRNRYGLTGLNIYERKKQIIGNSLYGVEVKEWAVWICQLRLWLTLFVDAPDDLKNSLEPILPSLDFKVRQGDSLVQRVGSKMFPVTGHIEIQSKSIKEQITKLKKYKIDYFNNRVNSLDENFDYASTAEVLIYRSILDYEIEEKKQKLQFLNNTFRQTQAPLFSSSKEVLEQLVIELDKTKITELEKEIEDLKIQKNLLNKEEKPLVWSIEFAETFSEKGGFDIIIGNPPYVRQESIEDPTGKIKDKKEYKDLLSDMVKQDFPNHFSGKTMINAKSDLYTYFYIRGLKLLNPSGIQVYICSNSWLDVGYGAWLQEFLLKRCKLDLIIDSSTRSFKAADINTIISVVESPQKKVRDDHLVKFVAFKKSFEESIFTENLVKIDNSIGVESSEIFRVYPIKVKDLLEAGTEFDERSLVKNGKYVGDKWGGKYLRAPNIFFTILEKGKGKLVRLGDIAEVSFGIKTGVNDFFYLDINQIKQFGIEDEFLKPVIKGPRECKGILVNPKDLKYKIFICNKNKEELKGTNALKYIEWGEKQKKMLKDGKEILWKDVQSVKGRKRWWDLGQNKSSNFLWTMTYRERFFVVANSGYLADARMYNMYCDNYIGILCNSTIILFQLELMARGYGGGGGPVDVKVYEVNNLLIPNLKNYEKVLEETLSLFRNRDIKTIFEECGIDPKLDVPIEKQEPKPLPDRAELDRIVFDVLGLTEDERKEVYRAVCRLVWNRISKANSL